MENSIEQISSAAKNYAEALIQIGQEGLVSFEKLSTDLEDVNDTIAASSELSALLSDPSVTDDIKISILETIFADKIDTHLVSFLKILVQKKRITEFTQIYADFVNKLNEINNIQTVVVVSAVELTDTYKEKIVQNLTSNLNKTIQPLWQVDEDIIAGITVKVNDDVIDMSLKTRIDKLSKSLMLK